MGDVVAKAFCPALHSILQRLHDHGFLAYAVGGAVRDALLSKMPFDFDITTSATPDQTAAVFSDCKQLDIGKKHGTITVFMEGTPFEITTFRSDGAYSDARHPDSVSFAKSVKADVARRDFTVNALCWNKNEGVVDLCGGLSDLENGILRAVGQPQIRMQEDALRILRGLRFAAQLGFKIEPKTKAAMLSERHLLVQISKERIREEFTKILCAPYMRAVLTEFAPIFEVFLPELSPLLGCAQHTPYHCYDVYLHTLVATEAIEPSPLLRLTMFFHDFAKPLSKTTDARGQDHFKGHQKLGAAMVEPILKRLRYDKKTIKFVTDRIAVHDLKAPRNRIEAKELLALVGVDVYRDLVKIKRADTLAKAEPHALDEKLERMQTLLQEVLDSGDAFSIAMLAINGKDLQNVGIRGKAIQTILQTLLEAVIQERCPNERKALLRVALQMKLSQ